MLKPRLGFYSFSNYLNSKSCKNNYQVCDTNYWSMSLTEGGKYKVEVQVGSNCASDLRMYYLQVNGVPIISGVALNKGEYHWVSINKNLKSFFLNSFLLCRLRLTSDFSMAN